MGQEGLIELSDKKNGDILRNKTPKDTTHQKSPQLDFDGQCVGMPRNSGISEPPHDTLKW